MSISQVPLFNNVPTRVPKSNLGLSAAKLCAKDSGGKAYLCERIQKKIDDRITREWLKLKLVAEYLDNRVDWSRAGRAVADKARRLGMEAAQVSITAAELPKKETPQVAAILLLAEGKTPDTLDATTVQGIRSLAEGIAGMTGRNSQLLTSTEELLHLLEMRELVGKEDLAGFASYVRKLQAIDTIVSRRISKSFLIESGWASILP